MIERVRRSGAQVILNASAYDIEDGTASLHVHGSGIRRVVYKYLIIATGAYDRPVAFPGWTLPGVITAGAAQVLTKSLGIAPGQRVLMAGNGPLALAFAAQLHKGGVNITAVLESAPRPRLWNLVQLTWACVIAGQVPLLMEGAGYLFYLWRKKVPFHHRHVVTGARGVSRLDAVTIARIDARGSVDYSTERTLDVDTICLGYGLCPSRELWALCDPQESHIESLGGRVPTRNNQLETSVPQVFVVGDCAGVNGVDVAVVEGELAGLEIASILEQARKSRSPGVGSTRRLRLRFRRKLDRLLQVRNAINAIYPVPDSLYALAAADTIVCRCEEVTHADIVTAIDRAGPDTNAVKAISRAGMGRCQGRNCEKHVGSMVAAARGLPLGDVDLFIRRPPARPVPLGVLAIPHDWVAPIPQTLASHTEPMSE
jgi:thioredoxin reductase